MDKRLFFRPHLFYKFLLYLLVIIDDPKAQFEVKRDYTGWNGKDSLKCLFRKLKQERILKENYKHLRNDIIRNYKLNRIFRNFRGHETAYLDQTLFEQQRVKLVLNRKRGTITYQRLSQLANEAKNFLKRYERIIRAYFPFYEINEKETN